MHAMIGVGEVVECGWGEEVRIELSVDELIR
jgi:hypothetical protein